MEGGFDRLGARFGSKSKMEKVESLKLAINNLTYTHAYCMSLIRTAYGEISVEGYFRQKGAAFNF